MDMIFFKRKRILLGVNFIDPLGIEVPMYLCSGQNLDYS